MNVTKSGRVDLTNFIWDFESATVKCRVIIDYAVEASFSVILENNQVVKGESVCFRNELVD